MSKEKIANKLKRLFKKRARGNRRIKEGYSFKVGTSTEQIDCPKKPTSLSMELNEVDKSGPSSFVQSLFESKSLHLNNKVRLSDIPVESYDYLDLQDVRFTCPFLGTEILAADKWKEKINNFFLEQLRTDKCLTSCLMVHTLNGRNDSKQCVETLCAILENIILYPSEEKFKKIRAMNKTFQKKIVKAAGAIEFLESVGFIKKSKPFDSNVEDFYILPLSKPDLLYLKKSVSLLRNTEPIILSLYRNVKVFKPSQLFETIEPPDDFFNLTTEEIKREQLKKTENLNDSSLLKTKEMLLKDNPIVNKYLFTLIRVRFPDNLYLQGTFKVVETLGDVKNFIIECVIDSVGPFCLTTSLGTKLTGEDESKTLLELNLVPAVLLIFVPLKKPHSSEQSFILPDMRKSI